MSPCFDAAPGGASAPDAWNCVVIPQMNAQGAPFAGQRHGETDLHAGIVNEIVGLDPLRAALNLDAIEDVAIRSVGEGIAFG